MSSDFGSCLGPPVLSATARIREHTNSGLWGQSSLPSVFFRHVDGHGDRLAIVDAPDRPSRGAGPARRLTYAQADPVIRSLAGRFVDLGLRPGDVVAVQLPQQAEMPLALLACLGLGFIVCPLPLSWRRTELETALASLGARAIITWGDRDDRSHVEDACAAAFKVASIRFVFAFGKGLVDGVTPIDGAFDGTFGEPMPRGEFPLPLDANAISLVTWDDAGSPRRALARSHNEWLACGMGVLLTAGLADGAKILSPYALTGVTGLAAGFVPWLLTGGLLALHLPFDLPSWRQQIAEHRPDWALMPGVVANVLGEAMGTGNHAAPRSLGLVGTVPSPIRRAPKDKLGDARLVTLTDLDQLALLARSGPADPDTVPLGAFHAGGPQGPTLFQIRALWDDSDGDEESAILSVAGACAPSATLQSGVPGSGFVIASDGDGYVRGRTSLRPVGDDRTAFVGRSGSGDTAGIGSLSVSLAELDRLYSEPTSISDAAAVVVADPIMGQRLFAAVVPAPGADPGLDDIVQHLDAAGVAIHNYPEYVLVVDAIPRRADGAIDRTHLTPSTLEADDPPAFAVC